MKSFFLLVIYSHLYSIQLCLEISISTNAHNLLQFLQCAPVKEKGGKPHRKPHPLPSGLNPYRNLKSENSQDYAQKPQTNCTFMNSASGHATLPYRALEGNASINMAIYCTCTGGGE
jgi:hypothetical protein